MARSASDTAAASRSASTLIARGPVQPRSRPVRLGVPARPRRATHSAPCARAHPRRCSPSRCPLRRSDRQGTCPWTVTSEPLRGTRGTVGAARSAGCRGVALIKVGRSERSVSGVWPPTPYLVGFGGQIEFDATQHRCNENAKWCCYRCAIADEYEVCRMEVTEISRPYADH